MTLARAMAKLAPGKNWRVLYREDGTTDYSLIEWNEEKDPKPTEDEVNAAMDLPPVKPSKEQIKQRLNSNPDIRAVTAQIANIKNKTVSEVQDEMADQYFDRANSPR